MQRHRHRHRYKVRDRDGNTDRKEDGNRESHTQTGLGKGEWAKFRVRDVDRDERIYVEISMVQESEFKQMGKWRSMPEIRGRKLAGKLN